MAEPVDARDLKSLDPLGHVGSTPTPGTNQSSASLPARPPISWACSPESVLNYLATSAIDNEEFESTSSHKAREREEGR